MSYTEASPIHSYGLTTPEDIQAWFEDMGPALAKGYAPDRTYLAPPADLGAAIVRTCEEAEARSRRPINHDLVAAQILKESAAWQSAIVRAKNNPSGLGAINSAPMEGAITFETPSQGIIATVAHLMTYTLGRENPWWGYDPRAEAVPVHNLGIVRMLRDLDGRWAVPGKGYGTGIAKLANELTAFSQRRQEQPMPYPIHDLIDIRGHLASNHNGGPGYGVPLSSKAGVIVHYSGPAVNLSRSDLDIIKGEAVYHVNKNWGNGGQWVSGDGYMYHLCIGRNGEKWLTRDLEAVLWHCGSWPENETWYSVHVPIGEGQRATPKQLNALGEVVNDLLAIRNLSVDRVKGHLEVQSTSCPGSLMRDFVYPFRAGTFRQSAPAIAMDHARFDVPATHGEKWVIAPLYRRFAAVDDPIGILGYPITGMALDGEGHEVQAFERAIMRHVPGSWPEKANVQLDLLGRLAAQVRGYVNKECLPVHPAFQQAQPIAGQRFFEETRHNLGGGFRGFWERYGGLDLYGYPLSEEFQEDGKTVQYFERARFEWHPGVAPERFDVLLGRIGAEVLEAVGNIA